MGNTQHKGVLCYACKFAEVDGKIITHNMSKCEKCNNQINSGYILCLKCSTKRERCYECEDSINFDKSELDNKLLKLVLKKNELCDGWVRTCNSLFHRMTDEKIKKSIMAYGYSFHEKCNTTYIKIHLDLTDGKRNFI
jgi:NAD-dependent SIR2 family protein deacetylase